MTDRDQESKVGLAAYLRLHKVTRAEGPRALIRDWEINGRCAVHFDGRDSET